MAATLPTTKTITVSADWRDVQSIMAMVNNTGDPTTIVPPGIIDAITSSLHADFDRAPVSLTPAGTDWSSMTVPFSPIDDDLPGTGGTPVKIEIAERQPLASQVRLLSGHFPVVTPVPAPAASPGEPGGSQPAATVQVVMTKQTAATLGLQAGSKFVMPGSDSLPPARSPR